MVAATTLFEGSYAHVEKEHAKMVAIADKFGGISAGGENGIKGYQVTFMIAYLRDFCFNYSVVGESFETSCQWSKV